MDMHECSKCTAVMPENLMDFSGGKWFCRNSRACSDRWKSVHRQPIGQSMDIESGLGIGGINNDQSMPTIPSLRALDRVQKMHDTDTVCRRCGASKNFGGAMFTTLGGSGICDDCA